MFGSLGIGPELSAALRRQQITQPTAIQRRAIPRLVGDTATPVAIAAQTGTGKTLCYVLPLAQQALAAQPGLLAAVLAPTRVLAAQIRSVLAAFTTATLLSSLHAIPKNHDGRFVLVTTPNDAASQVTGAARRHWRGCRLVLDEADIVLCAPAYRNAVRSVLQTNPAQTVLVGASFGSRGSASVGAVARRLFPGIAIIGDDGVSDCDFVKHAVPDTLEERFVYAGTPIAKGHLDPAVGSDGHDRALLDSLSAELARTDFSFQTGLIFVRSSRQGAHVARLLRASLQLDVHEYLPHTHDEAALHAKHGVVVCTDALARGIDIEHVSHVVQYELIGDASNYMHRVGRTARAGRRGVAVTLYNDKTRPLAHALQCSARGEHVVNAYQVYRDLHPLSAEGDRQRQWMAEIAQRVNNTGKADLSALFGHGNGWRRRYGEVETAVLQSDAAP